MKKIALLIGLGSIIITSCSDKKRHASIVYMPDMYYPTAYDPYEKATFGYPHDEENSEVPVMSKNHNMSALESVEGAVARTDGDILPWTFKNNNAGYAQAKAVTVSPLNAANKTADLERGKVLYGQNCAVCHGDAGDGQGSIVKSKAYSGVPTYGERDITVGSVYHVIMYGKNAMGSYASQLIPADRWRVAEYVMSLKGGSAPAAPAGEVATEAAPATETATNK
ncbi:c-type cytochrome [Empedobacter brevis]|uniref:Cytochrome c n=1 Tax=Empedobacter brevis NBRC 14943 = ATCC 43319 TaxID=1218108 RepID=A0A511NHY7_9FLAO|nr:cytochrome c [Empedobacter brevis]GEM52422.1 cytochrome c [Empedobacter brevis NBRC 14943 = ATCC 43319]